MMLVPVLILFLIAAILGVWSASLLWRAWHASRLRRRARRGQSPGATIMTPVRGRLGVGVALISLPLAGSAFSFGEYVRTGMWSDEFDFVPVVLHGVSAMFLLLALGALYVAWRFDPAIGRRRCGKCWYDMSATNGLKCPECGREPSSEKGLYRTRRAPRLVVVAVLLLIAAYSMRLAPRVHEHGWAAAIPTTALILGMPWLSDEMVMTSDSSLHERWYSDSMWGWQYSLLQWRCNRVIRNSEDLDAVVRAREFSLHPAMLNNRALLALLRDVCGSDQTRAGWSYELAEMMPRSLDEQTAREAREILLDAMKSTGPKRRAAAVSWCPTIRGAGVPLIPYLDKILRNKDEIEPIRMLAVYALGHLAASDDAWESVRWAAVEAESTRVRTQGFRVMGAMEIRRAEAFELASVGMIDPDPAIAQQAGILRVRYSAAPCDDAAACIALIERRPGSCDQLLYVLAGHCQDDRVCALVEGLLNNPSGAVQQSAALAAGRLGAAGKSLLPRLNEIARKPGVGMEADVAGSAIHEIEEVIEAAKSQPGG